MISTIAFICGVVLSIVAVILFFKFDIPALIGELSGRTAEKKVQEIREQNRQAFSMRQRGSERRRKVPLYDTRTETRVNTIKQQDEATEVLYEQTTLLNEEVGTTLLDENNQVEEKTTLLSNEMADGGTTLLDEVQMSADADFYMVEDVVEVHTQETI